MHDAADEPLPPGLYVVATPIGHLGDLSPRALDVLSRAAVIAAEDTRVTGKLLHRFSVATPMTPYHDHNADKARPALIERALHAAVALVSDAGTPLISDPGYKLVRDAAAAGVRVVPVPGPSAMTAALSIAGLPTDRVLFLGFLPAKTKARRDALAEVAAVRATLVLYESPNRLADCLADALAVLGDREAVVARELTKLFEEVSRGSLGDLADRFAHASTPKGEIVIVIGPPGAAAPIGAADLDDRLRTALAKSTLREAVEMVTVQTGLARKQVYARALMLRDEA